MCLLKLHETEQPDTNQSPFGFRHITRPNERLFAADIAEIVLLFLA
jgi:hypothetical protein